MSHDLDVLNAAIARHVARFESAQWLWDAASWTAVVTALGPAAVMERMCGSFELADAVDLDEPVELADDMYGHDVPLERPHLAWLFERIGGRNVLERQLDQPAFPADRPHFDLLSAHA